MATINWRATTPQSMQNGSPGDTGAYGYQIDNHTWLEAEYRPQVIAAPIGPNDGSGAVVTATSLTTAIRFVMPQDQFEKEFDARLLVKVSGGTFTLKGIEPGGGYGQTTTTSTSATWITVTIRPRTHAHPRECTIDAKVDSGETGYIYAIDVSAKKSASDGEQQPAGFDTKWAAIPDGIWDVAKMPIQSELIGRLLMGPGQVAADRPACFVSLVDDAQSATGRAAFASNSTDATIVARFLVAKTDEQARAFRLSLYVETSGTAAASTVVTVGSTVLSSTSTGWVHHTFSVGSPGQAGFTQAGAVAVQVTSGSGYVMIRSLQLMRE